MRRWSVTILAYHFMKEKEEKDANLRRAVISLCDSMTPGFFFKGLLPPGTSPEIVELFSVRTENEKDIHTKHLKKI